jgi:hypothetical protein
MPSFYVSVLQCDVREWHSLIDLLNTAFVAESGVGSDGLGGGAEGHVQFNSAALGFLKRLLSFCENKRYFQAFEVSCVILTLIIV